MYDYVLRANGWTNAPIFCAHMQIDKIRSQLPIFMQVVQQENLIWPFDLHIYIRLWVILKVKVKVKVWYTSTAINSKIATDEANITIAVKYEVAYRLSIGTFRFDLGLC